MRVARPLVLAGVVVIGAACGSSGSGSGGSGGGLVLYPTTKVLDAATLALLASWSSDRVTLTFSGNTPVLDGVQAGDVIMGGVSKLTPGGVLRRVKSVQRGSSVTLTTDAASLHDAIQSGKLTYAASLKPDGAQGSGVPGAHLSAAPAGSGLHTLGTGTPPFTPDFTVGFPDIAVYQSSGVSVTVGGSVGVQASVSMNVDFGSLTATVQGQLGETGALDLTASATPSFDQKQTIYSLPLAPTPISLDPPIILTPSLNFFIGASGSFSASLQGGASEWTQATVTVGLQNGSLTATHTQNGGASFDASTAGGTGSLQAYAGVQLGLDIDGYLVLGPPLPPTAEVSPYLELDGFIGYSATNGGSPPSCSLGLDVGADLQYGVGVSLFGAQILNPSGSTKLFDDPAGNTTCTPPATSAPAWAELFGGTGQDTRGVATASDGGSYVAGSQGSNLWLARLAPAGGFTWQQQITSAVGADTLAQTPDGFVAGDFEWIARFASNGNAMWSKSIGPNGALSPSTPAIVGATSDGGFVLATQTYQNNAYWLSAAKIDATGNLLWSNYYGQADQPHAVVSTGDGGVAIGGENSSGTTAAGFVLRLRSDGSVAWQTGTGTGRVFGVAPLGSGSFGVVGDDSGANSKAALLGSDGSIKWAETLSVPLTAAVTYATGTAYAAAPAGSGFVLAGEGDVTVNNVDRNGDVWVAEILTDGSIGWSRLYGGAKEDGARNVAVLGDGTLLVQGFSWSFGANPNQWLLHLAQDGNVTFTSASGVSLYDESLSATPVTTGGGGSQTVTKSPLSLALTDEMLSTSAGTATIAKQTP